MVDTNYEISSKTCALCFKDERTCILIEGDKKIIIEMPLNEYLNYNCNYYGSSFHGRVKGSQTTLGMKYKLPIIIEESKELIFFPTKSYKNKSCSWISLNNILGYEADDFSTLVTFTTGIVYKFDISIESFENQVLRATRLLMKLKNRKQNL